SWKDFGKNSAIFHAAEVIKDIYNIKVPDNPKTTYNVGIIKGGTSINTIAGKAEIEVDLRSTDKTCLERLYHDFINIIDSHRTEKVKISIKVLGERPCGKTSHDSKLTSRIKETRYELGMETSFRASSTDANYPMSLGIPSISFGIGEGDGVHTQDEYLVIDSIKTGMKHLMCFMLKYAS
ncbi:MAG: M20/M25/M40 family metallo-hydrolase, partial [Clostridiaceae bacterium]|nr:M20/M25/M40 family metallo-hydrolase [Clostridiaceae bacterium]